MSKQNLIFRKPLMNGAGSLGFTPDFRAPVPWEDLGAFVTNPISLRARAAASNPVTIEYPGGFLLHTGLPNPGFDAVLKRCAKVWKGSSLPVIVHLMADRPEETKQMVERLEGRDNILAVEFGFAPLLANDLLLITLEMCVGELPLILCLPAEQVLSAGPRLIEAGAAAISLAPPRGALPSGGALVTGRLSGPSLFPRSLDIVRSAVQLGLPIIGAGGVYSQEDAEAMIGLGALAVQLDSVLWKGWED
jgi:dihydroorotate dehydrogenase (NAD+) catalytic subunit